MRRVIEVTEPIAYKYENSGVFCFITRDPSLLSKFTDRSNVVLKIFWTPLTETPYVWGHPFLIRQGKGIRNESSLLFDSLRIQNIFAREGLAPFVYDVDVLKYNGESYPVVVCEDMGEKTDINQSQADGLYAKMKEVMKKEHLTCTFFDTGENRNIMGGKFIDFQGWHVHKKYKAIVQNKYKETTKWAGNTYQSIPELGILGYRGPGRLYGEMAWPSLLKGAKVLDIGCSGGEFTRLSLEHGASRVTCVDLPEVLEGTFAVNNYLGYFNVDYKPMKLEHGKNYDFGDFDVVFYMSMQRHLGLPDYLFKAQTVFYEHNGDEDVKEILRKFGEHYKIIKDCGVTGTNDERHSYIITHKIL